MARNDYYEMLEALAERAAEVVRTVCLSNCYKTEGEREKRVLELKCECETSVCEIEARLFSDFVPPLQRENIAAYAHSLSRIVDRAYDLSAEQIRRSGARESDKTCVKLAEKLLEATRLLRNLRSPSCKVDVNDFRRMLCEGRRASAYEMQKIKGGILPASYADRIYGVERLRYELSACFDCLVEVMLNNI